MKPPDFFVLVVAVILIGVLGAGILAHNDTAANLVEVLEVTYMVVALRYYLRKA